jgi:hypothetical protein
MKPVNGGIARLPVGFADRQIVNKASEERRFVIAQTASQGEAFSNALGTWMAGQ